MQGLFYRENFISCAFLAKRMSLMVERISLAIHLSSLSCISWRIANNLLTRLTNARMMVVCSGISRLIVMFFMFLRYHGRLANARIFLFFFRVRFDLFNSRAESRTAPIRKRARPGIAPIKKRAKYFLRKLLNAKALRARRAPKSLILSDLRVIY